MGTCDSLIEQFSSLNNSKISKNKEKQKEKNFCAPIKSSGINTFDYDNMNLTNSKMTSDYKINELNLKAPSIDIYDSKINNTNVKGSNFSNSTNIDGDHDSSYDGGEMIIDGKLDVNKVENSKDINTVRIYNEFIAGNDDEEEYNSNKDIDYYKKNSSNEKKNKQHNKKDSHNDRKKKGK